MAIEYTWNIAQLDCYPEHEGNKDVAFNAHWTLTGTDGEFSGSAYGSQSLTLDPKYPFTPFEKLTQDQVIGWVKGSLGKEAVAAMEEAIAQQIADQIDPPVVNPPLPWNA